MDGTIEPVDAAGVTFVTLVPPFVGVVGLEEPAVLDDPVGVLVVADESEPLVVLSVGVAVDGALLELDGAVLSDVDDGVPALGAGPLGLPEVVGVLGVLPSALGVDAGAVPDVLPALVGSIQLGGVPGP